MRKFVCGLIVGLMFSAGVTVAEDSLYKQAMVSVIGIRVELQRIANALDRLVSIQSGATKQTQVERNQ